MYRIGYFDDENREFENYKIDFKNYNIELLKIGDIQSKADLREEILNEQLDAIIIDFDLSKFHNVDLADGNEIVRYLNIEIPDFPSIILTSYPNDSKRKNTVINNLILDRDILTRDSDSLEYQSLIDTIINLIEVFHKRQKLNQKEFNELFKKRNSGVALSSIKEQRMISLYHILLSYDLIDEINPLLLTPSLSNKLDEVINAIKKLSKD